MSPKASLPPVPGAELLAQFTQYREATKAVEQMVENNFPVKSISIVGSDVRTVETVKGKLGYGRVAISGAITGSWLGLFLGLVMGASSATTEALLVSNVGAGIVIGAGAGMLFNIIRFSLTKNRRNFISAQNVVASKYEIWVPKDLVATAKSALEAKPSKSS
ncbi:MAG: general stress protein [Actinomycetota bacterium]